MKIKTKTFLKKCLSNIMFIVLWVLGGSFIENYIQDKRWAMIVFGVYAITIYIINLEIEKKIDE
jgi:hypothetical protein